MKIASIVNGQPLYYHGDHLGSTNVLSDANGIVKELMEYMPFGSFSRHEKYGTAQEVAEFYFTGQRYDDETGLYFYNARYYNPTIGRFITPDIFVQFSFNPQNLSRYTYVGNNPVNISDPTGHFWFFAMAAALFKAASAYAVAHPIIAGAVAGGFLGGVNSAISGTNIGQGIGIGILGGAIGGGIGLGAGDFLREGMGGFWSGMAGSGLGGAAAGAATSGVLGGDAGMGALAGLAGGMISYAGSNVWSLGADAVAGGVSSQIQGGSFGEGAKFGAIDNAVTTTMDLMMPSSTLKEQNPQAGDTVYFKPDSPTGYLISFFEGGAYSHTGIVVGKDQMAHTTLRTGGGIVDISKPQYANRQVSISKRFRGNQNVINAATSLTAQYGGHNRYGFLSGQKVCSTLNATAYDQAGYRGWYGIGPNSQLKISRTYGE